MATNVNEYVASHPYREVLEHLRHDIVLGSLYLSDYQNRYDLPVDNVSTWFDGYMEDLEDMMAADVPDFDDRMFFDLLPQYDNIENLVNWFEMCEESIGGIDLDAFLQERDEMKSAA